MTGEYRAECVARGTAVSGTSVVIKQSREGTGAVRFIDDAV
jgi:hypothetical protein